MLTAGGMSKRLANLTSAPAVWSLQSDHVVTDAIVVLHELLVYTFLGPPRVFGNSIRNTVVHHDRNRNIVLFYCISGARCELPGVCVHDIVT